MLEKLITDLKKSLPGPLRKKLGIAEDSMEYTEKDSEETVAPKKNAPIMASMAPASDDKKKRNSMILRVAIILGIAYFALDEFVMKADKAVDVDQATAVVQVKKKKKPKTVVAPVDANAAANTAPENSTNPTPTPTTETAATPSPEQQAAQPAQNEVAPPIENVNVLTKTEPPAETKAPEVVTETRVGEATVDKKIDQLMDNVEQSAPTTTEEVKIPSQPLAQSQEQTQSKSPAEEPKKENTMASKITEEVAETLPPAYDQVGRGLVYNCKDKYWACVDKPTYITCNRNMKWNKSKGNSNECVVQDIYNSDEDCAKIQKYNVTTNVATSFCSATN